MLLFDIGHWTRRRIFERCKTSLGSICTQITIPTQTSGKRTLLPLRYPFPRNKLHPDIFFFKKYDFNDSH